MAEVYFLDTDDYTFTDGVKAVVLQNLEVWEPHVRDHLPMLPTRLNVTIDPTKRVIPETGQAGFCHSKDWISLGTDPDDHRGVAAVLRAQTPSWFAHEAHHAARYVALVGATYEGRVVTTAVNEGLATVFQEEVTGVKLPWAEYDGNIVDKWVEEVLGLQVGESGPHWRYLHPDGRRWVAYKGGTRIVEQACEATGKTAAELVAASTDEVLDAAGLLAGGS